jgi:autoinducer 2-degrading protein
MYVVCVNLRVKPEKIDDFLAHTIDNASSSRKEPGCLRFDVLRHETEVDRFLLHEVYRTREDFKAHQEQPHYFRWRDRVPELLAEPRSGVKYVNVYPKDEEW